MIAFDEFVSEHIWWIFSAIFAIIFLIGLFFVFRFVTLWYFRINDIIKNQKRTNELLEKLLDTATKDDPEEQE